VVLELREPVSEPVLVEERLELACRFVMRSEIRDGRRRVGHQLLNDKLLFFFKIIYESTLTFNLKS
jgi:hypothetical protein